MVRRAAIAASVLIAAPALADEGGTPPARRKDTVTISAGAAVYPRFQGARSSGVSPVGTIRGTVKGIDFSTVGTALVLNVWQTGGRTDIAIGPVVQLELNRSGIRNLHEAQVSALGKIKPAVELGGHLNISRTGIITSAYDSLTFDIAAVGDVSGVNDSFIVTPSVSYGTPLSHVAYASISLSAEFVGAGHARRYFGVTPAQQPASGLPAYAPGGGLKDVSASAFASRSLTGDLRHGLAAYAVGNFARLTGDIARSPIVRDRNQVFGSVGLSYTF